MSLSIKPAALLGALFLTSGAWAQDEEDQAHRGTPIRRPDLSIPKNPPCVDGALVGTLRWTGELGTIDYHPIRVTIRWFEFRPRSTLFGPAAPASIRFPVSARVPKPDRDNAVLLVRKTAEGAFEAVHDDLFISDRRGREFVPIVWGPVAGLRGASWLPLGFEAFAPKIRYEDKEMRARGHAQKELAERARWRDGRKWVHSPNGRAIVRRGIYLDELEAMFAAERPDRCHRPVPRLANPGSNR